MNILMERDLNALASRPPQSNGKGRGVIWSGLRHYLPALAALGLLLSCGLSQSSASGSDFDLYWQDQKSGDEMFVNFVTGDYLFLNSRKQSFVAGKAKISVSDCAMELRDSGPNRKRPDREVRISYNPCDNLVNAVCELFDSAERYAITDQTATLPGVSAGANVETSAVVSPTRFDGFCLEDDSRNYLLRFDGSSYLFSDRRKGFILQGTSSLVINGCKWKFTHDGPDPKRPDRHIYAEVNVCTREGNASVWIAATGRTYILHDSNIEDSNCSLGGGN